MSFAESLAAIAAGRAERAHWDAAFAAALDGGLSEAELADFLVLTINEDPAQLVVMLIAGAQAMRARMRTISAPPDAMDVCGAGGDNSNSLNVSTAVAFVVAACGAPVAKHGNRAASSRSGAADVLEALGLRLDADPAECFAAANLAFLFAPNHHPALARLAPVRRALGRRTVFNLLGPLCNPAQVSRQLIGVARDSLVAPMAQALGALGGAGAVICGADRLDEAAPEGQTLRATAPELAQDRFAPADAGLAGAPIAELAGGDPAYNAAALLALLRGERLDGAYASAVILNSACALMVAARVSDLRAGALMAQAALAEGRALAGLEALKSL